MTILQSFLLGLVQGITEFIPISSDGHLELAKVLLKVKIPDNLEFNLVVHLATVIAIIIVFSSDIKSLVKGAVKENNRDDQKFIFYIIIASIPVAILEAVFGDELEKLYTGNLVLTGFGFILTGTLLTISYFIGKNNTKKVGLVSGFIIGVAQAIAVLPGLSRSGSTIATALSLKIKREDAIKFSFLILIIPILGASFLWGIDILDKGIPSNAVGYLSVAFLTSLITGIFAAKFIINIIRKNKLYYFAGYCLIIGILTLMYGLLN